jgi:hypothetical protein
MNIRIRIICVGILIGCLLGCSTPTVSKAGSSGSLWFGGQTLSDICVVVHRKVDSSFQQIGFGTTDQTGFFHLLRPDGQEPLTLVPGDYSFTLESLGPQIVFPDIYLKPETTPLTATWASDTTSLDLKAPEELLANLPK